MGSAEDWMVSRGAIPVVGAAADVTLPPPAWATLPVATDVAPAVTITAARAAAPVVIRARMVPPGGSPTWLLTPNHTAPVRLSRPGRSVLGSAPVCCPLIWGRAQAQALESPARLRRAGACSGDGGLGGSPGDQAVSACGCGVSRRRLGIPGCNGEPGGGRCRYGVPWRC